MAYSKIIYNGKTLIDLTSDSIVADKLLTGYTAHGADGEVIEGACTFDSDTSDATAAASEILTGKTGYVKGSKVTGTMKNNASATLEIASKDDEPVIAQGFHDGGGKAKIADAEKAKLIAENIRQGVTILGIAGSMTGTEDAVAQSKEVTPSATEQVILPDTDQGYNYLGQVTVKAIPYEESENTAGGITVTIG